MSGAAMAHIERKAYRIAQLRLAWRLYADVTAGFAEYIAIGDGRVSILEKRAMNSEAQAFNATFTSSLGLKTLVSLRFHDALAMMMLFLLFLTVDEGTHSRHYGSHCLV